MERTQIYLTKPMMKKLDKEAEQKDITRSELIRNIVNKYYDNKKGELI